MYAVLSRILLIVALTSLFRIDGANAQAIPKSIQQGGSDAAIKERKNAWTVGIAGGLIGLGIPELEAKRYEGKIKQGNILISVHTENSDEIKRAKEIFTSAKAQDICTTGESSAPTPKGENKDTAPELVRGSRTSTR